MNIIAIDPGNTQSAYVVLDSETYKPILFGKVPNAYLYGRLPDINTTQEVKATAIEMVACYGMAVGKEVFDTCVWIGRYYENTVNPELVYRKEVKINLCHTMKAKDSNIIQALKDRFGDKGTKNNPGWFFGFNADVWQAYALAVTFIDMNKRMEA